MRWAKYGGGGRFRSASLLFWESLLSARRKMGTEVYGVRGRRRRATETFSSGNAGIPVPAAREARNTAEKALWVYFYRALEEQRWEDAQKFADAVAKIQVS